MVDEVYWGCNQVVENPTKKTPWEDVACMAAFVVRIHQQPYKKT